MECVQENMKCSDIKAESERNTVSGWSYFQQRILYHQSCEQALKLQEVKLLKHRKLQVL